MRKILANASPAASTLPWRSHPRPRSAREVVIPTKGVSWRIPTKAFLLSFAEALRNELKDTRITVTALQPGPTDTNFFHRAEMDDTKVGADKKDDPADVARDGFEALMSGKDHVVAGSFKNKLQSAMAQVTPETAKAEMHRKLSEPGSADKVKGGREDRQDANP